MKFVAVVVVAGGVGVALGMALAKVAGEYEPATDVGAGTTADSGATTAMRLGARGSPLAQVRVRILDARLFTDETPSRRQERRARMTVRIRSENTGSRRVTLPGPILRVGSVRVPADAAADAPRGQVDPLAAGKAQTVTLRFSLAGEATPKVVRDRRARIVIAGRSVAARVKVEAPDD